jgi:hypothetical protein
MNAYQKIQFSSAAVIANGVLALGLLSPNPAYAQGLCQVEHCATQAYCAAHNDTNKYCPARASACFGLSYIDQSACAGPITDINNPCYAEYAYYCYYS